MAYVLSPVNYSDLASCGHLQAHVCRRGWIAQCVMILEEQFEKMWLAGFTCLGGSMCYPSPSPIGSCCMIGESWLVRGHKLVTKLGRIVRGNPTVVHGFNLTTFRSMGQKAGIPANEGKNTSRSLQQLLM